MAASSNEGKVLDETDGNFQDLVSVERGGVPNINYLKKYIKMFDVYETGCSNVLMVSVPQNIRKEHNGITPEYKRNCRVGLEEVYIYTKSRKGIDLDMSLSRSGMDPFASGTISPAPFRLTTLNGKKIDNTWVVLDGEIKRHFDVVLSSGTRTGTGFKKTSPEKTFVARSEISGKYGFSGVGKVVLRRVAMEYDEEKSDDE